MYCLTLKKSMVREIVISSVAKLVYLAHAGRLVPGVVSLVVLCVRKTLHHISKYQSRLHLHRDSLATRWQTALVYSVVSTPSVKFGKKITFV